MNTVKIRALEIGAGKPGIIVPVVGKTREEILEAARGLGGARADMAEWRADHYRDVFDTAKVLDTAKALRAAVGGLPLLFTFRTEREGGEREMDARAYAALNIAAAQSGLMDLVDVEIFHDAAEACIAGVHAAGGLVVGSNHEFSVTPAKEEIVSRLRGMQDMGADLAKIAVMPACASDVLTLLAATIEMRETYADRPIITVSMGATGLVSRLAGEVFGSSMTFGSLGKASAPGQIPAEELEAVLAILHRALV